MDLSLEILMDRRTPGLCQSKPSFQKCSIPDGWGTATTEVSRGTEPKLIPRDIMIGLSSVPLWWDWGEAGNGTREESRAPVASKAGYGSNGPDWERTGCWRGGRAAVKAARRTAGSYHPEVGALSSVTCPVILGELLKFSDAGVKCIYENIKIHHHYL